MYVLSDIIIIIIIVIVIIIIIIVITIIIIIMIIIIIIGLVALGTAPSSPDASVDSVTERQPWRFVLNEQEVRVRMMCCGGVKGGGG